MEQNKVTATAALKFACSSFVVHIQLYLQIAACIIAATLTAPYLRQLIESTDFIPSGHLDILATSTFQNIFKFWFWGACVAIAAHIIHTGHAHFSDFIQSVRYASQFIIIQMLFLMPISFANELTFSNDAFLLQIGLAFSVAAVIIQYYGQLAVPLFVINKSILSAIKRTFSKTHQLGLTLASVVILYVVIILMLRIIIALAGTHTALEWIGYSLVSTIAYLSFGDRIMESTLLGTIITHTVIYPLMALSYVYLCKKSE